MIFLFLIFHLPLFADVCLNMIVKDESDVITRCLASVKPVIDYWVIVDTGSSDGTQKIIKEFMKDIPGELHERPWKNFGHNRNEALDLAQGKGDYVLLIDADEVLEFEPGFTLPKLDCDFYFIMTHFNGTKYARVQLVNNHLPWRWKWVLHEAIDTPLAKTSKILPGVANIVRTDGARSKDPKKFEKDAAVLEQALLDEPHNTRYRFYLAQSYRDAGNNEKALENYQKRIEKGGWNEEVFYSLYQCAILKQLLDYPKEEVISSYYTAFEYRPTRSEPLYHLAEFYRLQEQYAHAYLIAKAGLTIPYPQDLLFVEHWCYDWGLLLECSISAYWLGKYQECYDQTMQLLNKKELPQCVRECAERNLQFAKDKLRIKI